jgi:hypothetical protein
MTTVTFRQGRSALRCAHCAEPLASSPARVHVCERCLGRHHAGCWRERCASCGADQALVTPRRVRVRPRVDRQAERREALRVWRDLWLVLVACVVLCLGTPFAFLAWIVLLRGW